MNAPHASETAGARALVGVLAAALVLAAPTVARASASVDLEVEPLNPVVGELIHVRYFVRIQNERQAQIDALDIGTLEPLSDVSPPEMMMFGGSGFGIAIMQTGREYVLRANAPGRYTIGNARIINAANGRVIAQHPPITIVVTIPGAPAGTTSDDAGGVTDAEPQAPPPPPDPDAPPAGDLSGAEYNPTGFLRVAVDDPNPYLGQQVMLRIWVYTASAETACELTEPALPGFWNESLPRPSQECAMRWFTQNVGGRYMSIGLVRKIAIFPTQTGVLTIGPARAQVETSIGGIFGRVTRFEARAPDLRVNVREPPAAGRPSDYVPGTIGPVSLTAELDRNDVAVGETMTVTVRATSTGSLASAVIVPPSNIDGVRIRSGGSRGNHDASNGRVISTLETELLVVPDRAGRIDLGEAHLAYWDPAANQYGVARAALPSIQAHGAPVAADAREHTSDPQIELRPLVAIPELRAYHTVFSTPASAVFAIGAPPSIAALASLARALARRIARRRRERADERRGDPATLLRESRRALASDRERAVSLAGRALDRALADTERGVDGGLAKLPAEARAQVSEARQICDAARFAGAAVDADEVLNQVERAVAAMERAL